MGRLDTFRLCVDDIATCGAGLSRPECVLTTKAGDLYVSDSRGGVGHLLPDGGVRHYYGRTLGGEPLGANGFAMLEDGSFLVAPLAGGGVYRLHRDGRSELFLDRAQDRLIESPNFVLLDNWGRVWICVLATGPRKAMTRFHRESRDGFIVLVDGHGPRVVAEGLGLPNEIRVDPSGEYLYVNESLATRLLRFKIRGDGSLGAAELVCGFDDSNMFDGFALDCEGGAWITTLVSNRLWYVDPDGEPRLIVEDCDPAHVEELRAHQNSQEGLPRDFLYAERKSRLRNISSVAFGGEDLSTVYLGSLMGDALYRFRAPVTGIKPAHWEFGPF